MLDQKAQERMIRLKARQLREELKTPQRVTVPKNSTGIDAAGATRQ